MLFEYHQMSLEPDDSSMMSSTGQYAKYMMPYINGGNKQTNFILKSSFLGP